MFTISKASKQGFNNSLSLYCIFKSSKLISVFWVTELERIGKTCMLYDIFYCLMLFIVNFHVTKQVTIPTNKVAIIPPIPIISLDGA